MTDEPDADRDLRAALGTLLADEPAAPPLVDDVARGRALVRRRRARAGALAGVAAVLVGIAVLAGALRPTAAGPPVAASPTPVPAPTASTTTDQVAAVTAELESLGFTVTSASSPRDLGGDRRSETVYAVRPSAAAPGSTSAELTVRAWNPVEEPGERSALPDSVMNGCDGTTCTDATSDGQVCGVGSCWGQWSATTTEAYRSQTPGSLVVLLADGVWAFEGVASPLSCPTCSLGLESTAFLTVAQLRSVLLAAADADAVPNPGPTAPEVDARACRDSDVKLIPAVDPETRPFERSVVVEVHARNPEVRCTVTGYAGLAVRGAAGETLSFDVVSVPSLGGASPPPVLVTQASTPAARFTVTQGRCEVEARVPVSALVVTLPGDDVPVTVELPSGLAPVSCPGGSKDATTLLVSPLSAP